VHLNGEAVRSCVTKLSRAVGQKVVTIEGLAEKINHPIQKAWLELDVPQCGYCQSGQIMSAAVLLRENKNPTDADIDAAMAGNICRCGTYLRIRSAIKLAAETQRKGG
jgi:isoquinoline 1-oxidoreductase alpha subunit